MKTIESNRTVTNSTNFKSHTFGIKSKNLSHLIHIVRDQIYSDKVLAVIREYACNACDANVMAGLKDTPIIVTLPSKLDPTFKVRDFGGGLSEQDIVDIFISYGESTKRNTNDAIGTLGIGSKSGFAYGDSFIVTSYNNGIKTVYDCVLDKTNVGNCLVLLSEPMKADEKEGIEITVNVKHDDIEDFRDKALNFFKYWTVKPELIGFTPTNEKVKEKTVLFQGSNWTIFEDTSTNYYGRNDSTSLALMGNIAYPIKWDLVKLPQTRDGSLNDKVLDYIKNADLVFRFNIGDVEFAPSREALQYTDHTINGINAAVKTVMAEIERVVTEKFKDCKNLFEAKALFGTLFGDTNGYSYHHGGLTGLKPYFEKKGLVWNGHTINSNYIEGFNEYDLDKGYKKGGHEYKDYNDMGKFPIHRYQMSGSVLKLQKGNRHNTTGIKCAKSVAILHYDNQKNNYVRKACHYLISKDSAINSIYVLDFEGKTALQTQCFKDLELDLVPITKYSDIVEDVKKTIIRSGSTGKTYGVSNPLVRGAKFVTVADNTYVSSYRRHGYSGCWTTVDINFNTDTGYYVELKDNALQWKGKGDNVTCVENACNVIDKLNKIGQTNITKIYGFGTRILDARKFDKTKWTRVEDVITEKFAALIADKNFAWYSAFRKVSQNFHDNNQMPSWTLVTRLAKKIDSKENSFVKLAELLKTHKASNTDNYDALVSMVGSKIKCDTEVATITDLIKTIINSYPMLMLCRSYQSAYSIDENDANAKHIATIADYINLIDEGENK